jgi:hypothetical protein
LAAVLLEGAEAILRRAFRPAPGQLEHPHGSFIVIRVVTIVFFNYNLEIVPGDGAFPRQTRIDIALDSARPDAFPP